MNTIEDRNRKQMNAIKSSITLKSFQKVRSIEKTCKAIGLVPGEQCSVTIEK